MSAGRRRLLGAAALAAVAWHLGMLYWPRVTVQGPVSWTDKVVHPFIFAIPLVLVSLWWGRWRLPLVAFLVHAPLSEVIQHVFLPHRDGSVGDAVADLVGVALGLLVLRVLWSAGGWRWRGPAGRRDLEAEL